MGTTRVSGSPAAGPVQVRTTSPRSARNTSRPSACRRVTGGAGPRVRAGTPLRARARNARATARGRRIMAGSPRGEGLTGEADGHGRRHAGEGPDHESAEFAGEGASAQGLADRGGP